MTDSQTLTRRAIDVMGCQEALAAHIDTCQQAVSNWLCGRTKPSRKYRERMLAIVEGEQ